VTVSAHQAISAALQRHQNRFTAPPLKAIRRPVTHRQGLLGRMHALEETAGSERGAAAAAGVTVRTWRGWVRNPFSRPSKRSLEGVEAAYREDLQRRTEDPLRQMRYAMAQARDTNTWIEAEIQWEGYYNGQEEKVKTKEPEAPHASNEGAHRPVKFGRQDLSTVVRAWKLGQDTRKPMEKVLKRSYGNSYIFLNSYFRDVSVKL
jgi:hypothetical protein